MRLISAYLLVLGLGLAAAAQVAPQAALSQPALSPDGAQIAFAANGAIWTVPARGGTARLLIATGATDSRPLYSPDGKWLAFESTRTGNGDIYLFDLADGQLRRLTWDDGADALDNWSPDSQWVYFSSSSHNIGGMNDIYRVRVDGGTPLIVTSERYESEYYAAAAPDGSVAFCAVGEMPLPQWWRNGHAHIDETEIWRVTPASAVGGKAGYQRILPTDNAKNIWPMFSPDGRDLYFMSDRSGSENLWELPAGSAPRPLTHFTAGRVLFPTIAANGKAIVFEHDFGVWMLDLKRNTAAAVPIQLLGAPATPSLRQETVTTVNQMAVSPDGEKVAFIAHGEVFAVGAEDGGPALRITHTGRMQSDLQWSPDSRRLAYVSDRDGHYHLYQYDFQTEREQALTHGSDDETHPVYSPDGKRLAFQRGINQVVELDLASGQETVLTHGYFDSLPPLGGGSEFAWSPDSKYLAYLDKADGMFPNAYVVSAAGGPGQQVSFLADSFNGAPAWSPDGKYLLLQTDQRTEPSRIARIDLVPQPPLFREDLFHALFEAPAHPTGRGPGRGSAPAPPADTPDIVYTGISRRISLLPMTEASQPRISPDGKWLAYIGSEGGSSNIYLMSLDEKAQLEGGGRGGRGGGERAPKQLTSTASRKGDLQFTADSKTIYYVDGGHISRLPVAGGASHAVDVSAELEVNFSQEKEEMFDQTWRYLGDNYMNPAMNGVNWDEVRTRYAPEVAGAETPDALRRVLSEMIGEMNSSHSGIGAPGAHRSTTGHLGLFFDRVEFETAGKLCVTEVVPLGPAALAGVRVGDCLDQVNGAAIGPATNLDQLLDDTLGHKLTLQLSGAGGARTASLKPVDAAAAKGLIYDAWVEHNRQMVDQLSGGALGYIHMADMSQGALDKLYMDLDSTNFGKKGVVVDIRNNNGGFVNAYALDVLTRRPYLTMVPRGFPQGPARVALGQRALERPTVLVVNQNSLSDSEDFTEGYEAMHLGKVVGSPTAGWIIFTSGTTLIDGSSLRLPTDRILDHNGKDMELHPRPVDVAVTNPIGSWQAGQDPQLAAAVKTLLAQVNAAPGTSGEKIAAGKQ